MIKLYGIPNCNTVKKAQTFLTENKVEFEFINFKKTAPNKTQIKRWKSAMGDWPVNKKGQTFRKFKEDYEAADAGSKVELILENTSMIKRPILEQANKVLAFGFDEDAYKQALS